MMRWLTTALGDQTAQAADAVFGNPDPGFWMPPQASEFAVHSDALFDFILWVSVFFFVLLMGLTVWFSLKYRQRDVNQRTSPVNHNFKLEFLWSAIPTVLLIVVFAWGFQDFTALSATPADALQLRVTGAKWAWTVQYPQYDRECSAETPPGKDVPETTFYVEAGRPFTVRMHSVDVLHSFWIPAFRTKRDVLPGRYTGYTVTPTIPGEYPLYCAEYCGDNHSRMKGTVVVLDSEEFKTKFLEDDRKCNLRPDDPEYGKKLFAKHCTSCHDDSPNQVRKTGPPLFGKYGTDESTTGGTVKVDDNYLRESILEPQAKIVSGYEGQNMTSFAGRLSEQELDALIDYIADLK